jgi:MtfA peptidase
VIAGHYFLSLLIIFIAGMDTALSILFALAAFILICFIIFYKKKKRSVAPEMPGKYQELLAEYVEFYKQLDKVRQEEFRNRMQHFLSRVRITGIKTEVEDIDKVLVAASAIIPIFGFPEWEYMNLNEVLLYPGSFDHTFTPEGDEPHALGLVGDGPYQNVMLLSRHDLRQGFLNKTGKTNTAIHEFVHLVDKTDGSVDGVPEFLVSRKYILPWLELMQRNIKQIMENRSDINPYGATNQAEFFAVVAEYFFERPELLQSKHPELYDLLATIFRQKPAE